MVHIVLYYIKTNTIKRSIALGKPERNPSRLMSKICAQPNTLQLRSHFQAFRQWLICTFHLYYNQTHGKLDKGVKQMKMIHIGRSDSAKLQ